MGFDLQMLDPPTPAEIRAAKLDESSPGYYRFNWSGMPVMIAIMVDAGAMSEDDDVVVLPDVPPIGLDPKRTEAIEEALGDPRLEVKLTRPELAFERAFGRLLDQLRRVQGKHPDLVPAFKFEVNSGFIVTPRECTIIATKLRAFSGALTQTQLDKLDALYRKRHAEMMKAIAQPGETDLMADQTLGLELSDAHLWIESWAAYNEVAAKHRGYSIN